MTRIYNKEAWGEGPWQHEPDRKEWKSHGFHCLMLRARSGILCGYVAIPPGHPWHGKGHHDIKASAHGGVNYTSPCLGEICHVPEPGEPDNVWWIGFDCGHGHDYNPDFMSSLGEDHKKLYLELGIKYRDEAYVTKEIEDLALQAKEAFGRTMSTEERKIVFQDSLGREAYLTLDQAEWLLSELKEGRLVLEQQERVVSFLEKSIADWKQKELS